MSNKYIQLREKYHHFNKWEIAYNKKISVETHLERFVKLYETGQFMDEQTIKNCHQKHLEALIEIQQKIKTIQKANF